jgi:hypothetical protein
VRVRFAIAIGLVLVAGMLAVGLFKSVLPPTGDNGRDIQLLAGVRVLPGQQACQKHERVPADSGMLHVRASTAGKAAGPLVASVIVRGQTLAKGTSPGGFVDSTVQIPVTPENPELSDATVCVRNAGRKPVALLGQNVVEDQAAVVSGDPSPPHGSMRLEWFESKKQTRLAGAGDVARRYGLAKASFFGSWTMWVMLALLLAASAGGIVLVAREAEREQ